MPTVRVTVERPCPACEGTGLLVRFWLREPADLEPHGQACDACDGRGAVDEPVTCAGCRHFREGNTILAHRCGLLVGIWSGESIGVDPDFACAAWEARR